MPFLKINDPYNAPYFKYNTLLAVQHSLYDPCQKTRAGTAFND